MSDVDGLPEKVAVNKSSLDLIDDLVEAGHKYGSLWIFSLLPEELKKIPQS